MIEKTNELLKNELSKLINERVEFSEGLITIIFVTCSSDLGHAKIALSVLPENLAGTGLNKVKKLSLAFAKELKNRTRLRNIPTLHWTIDKTEAEASELDEIFRQIELERKGKTIGEE
ncbi:MAG: ribosome-binding factor A [bacterium]